MSRPTRRGQGRASTPKVSLRPVAGSLLLATGLDEGQRGTHSMSGSATRRILFRAFDRRRRTGSWLDLTAARTAHVAVSSGPGWARSWHMAAVDVVVPGLKRLIEEGLLTAFGRQARGVVRVGARAGVRAAPGLRSRRR